MGVDVKVGVTLPVAEYPGRQPGYGEIRALAVQAELAGFDSVWVFDHLLFRESDGSSEGQWEAWTTLSALAEATDRVELGTLVMCTAFRNPAVLAKMAVTLDAISGGRLILGVGAGWHEPEFEAFGIDFGHRVQRFEEALTILAALLRTGRADFIGRHHWARGGELRPGGPRPGGPPILVGAAGPRMLRLAAQHADLWNGCWFGEPSSLGDVLDRVRAACAQADRDPRGLGLTLGVNVLPGIAETPPYPILAGSGEEIASGLAGYRDMGIEHVILNLNPHRAEDQRALTAAVRRYRTEYDPAP
jgi:probable F420-dependent oxidoreductase